MHLFCNGFEEYLFRAKVRQPIYILTTVLNKMTEPYIFYSFFDKITRLYKENSKRINAVGKRMFHNY